jgi:hypothetical protein
MKTILTKIKTMLTEIKTILTEVKTNFNSTFMPNFSNSLKLHPIKKQKCTSTL